MYGTVLKTDIFALNQNFTRFKLHIRFLLKYVPAITRSGRRMFNLTGEEVLK